MSERKRSHRSHSHAANAAAEREAHARSARARMHVPSVQHLANLADAPDPVDGPNRRVLEALVCDPEQKHPPSRAAPLRPRPDRQDRAAYADARGRETLRLWAEADWRPPVPPSTAWMTADFLASGQPDPPAAPPGPSAQPDPKVATMTAAAPVPMTITAAVPLPMTAAVPMAQPDPKVATAVAKRPTSADPDLDLGDTGTATTVTLVPRRPRPSAAERKQRARTLRRGGDARPASSASTRSASRVEVIVVDDDPADAAMDDAPPRAEPRNPAPRCEPRPARRVRASVHACPLADGVTDPALARLRGALSTYPEIRGSIADADTVDKVLCTPHFRAEIVQSRAGPWTVVRAVVEHVSGRTRIRKMMRDTRAEWFAKHMGELQAKDDGRVDSWLKRAELDIVDPGAGRDYLEDPCPVCRGADPVSTERHAQSLKRLWLQCTTCWRYIHRTCTSLSDAEADRITAHHATPWTCETCAPSAASSGSTSAATQPSTEIYAPATAKAPCVLAAASTVPSTACAPARPTPLRTPLPTASVDAAAVAKYGPMRAAADEASAGPVVRLVPRPRGLLRARRSKTRPSDAPDAPDAPDAVPDEPLDPDVLRQFAEMQLWNDRGLRAARALSTVGDKSLHDELCAQESAQDRRVRPESVLTDPDPDVAREQAAIRASISQWDLAAERDRTVKQFEKQCRIAKVPLTEAARMQFDNLWDATWRFVVRQDRRAERPADPPYDPSTADAGLARTAQSVVRRDRRAERPADPPYDPSTAQSKAPAQRAHGHASTSRPGPPSPVNVLAGAGVTTTAPALSGAGAGAGADMSPGSTAAVPADGAATSADGLVTRLAPTVFSPRAASTAKRASAGPITFDDGDPPTPTQAPRAPAPDPSPFPARSPNSVRARPHPAGGGGSGVHPRRAMSKATARLGFGAMGVD